ncbi:hypothetical protein DFH06DRAFT_1139402 [Mycena polygramma]|nr:hypothetical protein DFH06DRAFT_1139402 [Mycena polygramma]
MDNIHAATSRGDAAMWYWVAAVLRSDAAPNRRTRRISLARDEMRAAPALHGVVGVDSFSVAEWVGIPLAPAGRRLPLRGIQQPVEPAPHVTSEYLVHLLGKLELCTPLRMMRIKTIETGEKRWRVTSVTYYHGSTNCRTSFNCSHFLA